MAEKQPLSGNAPPPDVLATAPPPYVESVAPGNYGQPPAPYPYYQQGPPPPAQPYPVGMQAPPPPPPGVGVVMPPQTTVIVHQQRLGRIPATCTCPNCHQAVVTQTMYDVGLMTWLICGAIVLFGGWIFCLCLIPFCINDLKDVRHICPNCKYNIHLSKALN
ncbi:lipopolysaccharide-induced tumor necrosis factor-alpha factor homolog [Clavelina lepadiformis]|uniref:lipopolysaccharide-induced tumor necrosis factor-alpha factor homolog n=1 Tax=Clavelina lepadiformis TaxID=159417 RepID=UPI0040426E34